MDLTTELSHVFLVVIVECLHEEGLFASELATVLIQRMGSVFKGVYAIDELSDVPIDASAGYVIISDPHWLPGSHWMAVYTNTQGVTKFFDVFGLPP